MKRPKLIPGFFGKGQVEGDGFAPSSRSAPGHAVGSPIECPSIVRGIPHGVACSSNVFGPLDVMVGVMRHAATGCF
jgi:hypothetical protein